MPTVVAGGCHLLCLLGRMIFSQSRYCCCYDEIDSCSGQVVDIVLRRVMGRGTAYYLVRLEASAVDYNVVAAGVDGVKVVHAAVDAFENNP